MFLIIAFLKFGEWYRIPSHPPSDDVRSHQPKRFITLLWSSCKTQRSQVDKCDFPFLWKQTDHSYFFDTPTYPPKDHLHRRCSLWTCILLFGHLSQSTILCWFLMTSLHWTKFMSQVIAHLLLWGPTSRRDSMCCPRVRAKPSDEPPQKTAIVTVCFFQLVKGMDPTMFLIIAFLNLLVEFTVMPVVIYVYKDIKIPQNCIRGGAVREERMGWTVSRLITAPFTLIYCII